MAVLNFDRLQMKIFAAVTASTVILYGSVFGEETTRNHISDIEPIFKQIDGEPSGRIRAELAEKLANIVRAAPDSDQISDGSIADITHLLRNDDDAVRYWAALALGQLGPRATVAVPELESALEEVEARDKQSIVGPELSSADGIREALRKITGRAYEPDR